MKSSELKTLMKETVREVFQEEIKGLLLEALKSTSTPLMENKNPIMGERDAIRDKFQPNSMRDEYKSMLDGEISMSTKDLAPKPSYNVNPMNGTLPEGSVDLDQIMKLV